MSEPTDIEYRNAVNCNWQDPDDAGESVSVLATHAAIWRSRANYFRGKCEGLTETIAYLKERVRVLEAREAGDRLTAILDDGEGEG
jgi:hypothetical protein